MATAKEGSPLVVPTSSPSALSQNPSCSSFNTPVDDRSTTKDVSISTKRAKLLKSRVKRLEKKLELYDRKIKQVMESEVSLEEMNSDTSPYLQEDILKRKFLKTWVELCDLLDISPEVQIGGDMTSDFKGTKYPAINKRVKQLLRQGDFPDYWDVCQLVSRANEKHKLNIDEKECECLSRKLFQCIGEHLKKQRMKVWSALFGCHLTDGIDKDEDPAHEDSTLAETLVANLASGKEKLDEVYDNFAFKQEKEGDQTASSSDEEEELEEDVDEMECLSPSSSKDNLSNKEGGETPQQQQQQEEMCECADEEETNEDNGLLYMEELVEKEEGNGEEDLLNDTIPTEVDDLTDTTVPANAPTTSSITVPVDTSITSGITVPANTTTTTGTTVPVDTNTTDTTVPADMAIEISILADISTSVPAVDTTEDVSLIDDDRIDLTPTSDDDVIVISD